MKGRFITFEGIDGTGKSTQLALLATRMREEGYDVLTTKEPGSPADPTKLGLEVRQILFHTVTTHRMARGVADCLLLADHIQHVGQVVEPALSQGRVVLSDRYADSEFAYAVAKNTPGFMLDAYAAAFGPMPDITVLFVATDPGTMLERARARRGETHQSGKTWDDVNQQIAIQREYLSRLVGQSRTIVLSVTPDMTIGQTFEILWSAVSNALRTPMEAFQGEQSQMIEVSTPSNWADDSSRDALRIGGGN
jgi:dTMP kinase